MPKVFIHNNISVSHPRENKINNQKRDKGFFPFQTSST
jgi:hypothetical protein